MTHRFSCVALFLLGLSLLAAGVGRAAEKVPVLEVPKLQGEVQIDGNLTEPCYQARPLVADFKIASDANTRPPRTRAWVFWRKDKLVFAFDCEDSRIVAEPKSNDEMAVDHQDRVELFAWNGRPDDAYLCLELAPRGAVLDYSAKFYRRFDTTWNAEGLRSVGVITQDGYRMEAELPAETMRPFGITLAEGQRFRAGLFRGDAQTGAKDEKLRWITWVEAGIPKPDFHIAASFGTFHLVAH